jgi:hypothetical protein
LVAGWLNDAPGGGFTVPDKTKDRQSLRRTVDAESVRQMCLQKVATGPALKGYRDSIRGAFEAAKSIEGVRAGFIALVFGPLGAADL